MKSLKETVGKKLVKRNLPIQHYKIINTFYSEDYCACQNCNKAMKNIAVVEGEKRDRYHVGLDCAATLSGINNHDIEYWSDKFKIASAFRRKFLAACKKFGDNYQLVYQNSERSGFLFINWYAPGYEYYIANERKSTNSIMFDELTAEEIAKYLPDLAKKTLYNPNKRKYDVETDINKVPESGKMMDGYKIEYMLKTNEKYNYQYAYAEIYQGNKLIQVGSNGGREIKSCKMEVLRLLNIVHFVDGAKMLSDYFPIKEN